jgi:hypothetical protein
MQLSINFDFLTGHDAKLVQLAARAEYYYFRQLSALPDRLPRARKFRLLPRTAF